MGQPDRHADAVPAVVDFSGVRSADAAQSGAWGGGLHSATNNINARDIALAHASPAHAARLSSGIEAVRKTAEQFPMVAAVKHTLSLLTGDDDWRHLRPPLVPLDADTAAKVEARMRAALPALSAARA